MSALETHTYVDKNTYIQKFSKYKQLVDERISTLGFPTNGPVSLYEPFQYLLDGGGKRLRPILTLVATSAGNGDYQKALSSGIAIEILHNFTLVHDDIMDKAPIRRGRETIHSKWNDAVGILTGDVMMGYAYKLLLEYREHPNFARIFDAFTTGLIEVCEGQAYDLEFHNNDIVGTKDYLQMIEKKTAKLLQMSATIGGLIANCTNSELEALQQFALNIGIGFQIQDDYLDLYAEQEKLGKKIGKDLIEGKKTFQIVTAIENATKPEHIEFLQYYCSNKGITEEQIPTMKQLFDELSIEQISTAAVEHYFRVAETSIQLFSDNARNELEFFLTLLSNRAF